jgi:hypothetical protein
VSACAGNESILRFAAFPALTGSAGGYNRRVSRHMPSRSAYAALVGPTLAAAALLFAFDPAVTWWFPSCPFYALTGWLCPFCGTLRAAHALLHGHVAAALTLNPMVTAALAVGSTVFAYDRARPGASAVGPRLWSWCFSPAGAAAAAAFGILRNLHRLAG